MAFDTGVPLWFALLGREECFPVLQRHLAVFALSNRTKWAGELTRRLRGRHDANDDPLLARNPIRFHRFDAH